MKSIIKVEEGAQFGASVFALSMLPFEFAWYLWIGLFFLPDASIAGYIWGPRVGALIYNVFHHKATGIAIFLYGLCLHDAAFQLVGVLLFGHSAFDRMLGYGLKLPDSFHHTHLGRIGKPKGSLYL